MLKRFLFIFSTLLMAIAVLFIAAKDSPGRNTISLEDPLPFMLSVGMVIFLFIPPLVMSFFDHIVVRVISGIYQCFIVFSFLVLIPIGFFIPNGGMTILISILGFLVSLSSMVVTFMRGHHKEKEVSI
ncbi:MULTISPECIES: hypothetical protein [Bacillus]|uniref:hypothetical protein n=1 Tax=Bacillus TaxID=1386 RepID=UPI0006F910C7|nr:MULTISPECIES: hypothetical protein [Bacillus]KRE11406.1 hypothetical protein ASE42_16560 [Bacillus sp. Root920]GMG77555.1 hypothetical protein ShirakiTA10_05170 [Bacillus safensis]